MSQFENMRNKPFVGLDNSLTEVIRGINFPAFLALLANGATQNRPSWNGLQEAIVTRAGQEEAIITPNFPAQGIVSILRSLFIERQRPKTLGFRGDVIEAIVRAAVREVASRQGLPVSPETIATVLTLLGTGDLFKQSGPFSVLARVNDPRELLGDDLIRQLAITIAPQIVGGDEARIVSILVALLVEPRQPDSLAGINNEVLTQILRLAANEAAGQLGVPITVDEARTALRLLLTGEFFRDAVGFSTVVIQTIPRLPGDILTDIPSLPRHVFGLLQGVVTDTARFPTDLSDFITGVLHGSDPHVPLLHNTLARLYEVGTLREIASLLRALIAPENETARLALVLYARANGIPITQQHLDILRKSVLNDENPDFAPIVVAGVDFLRDRYQGELLGRLQNLVLG
jgi:hypothetical protein